MSSFTILVEDVERLFANFQKTNDKSTKIRKNENLILITISSFSTQRKFFLYPSSPRSFFISFFFIGHSSWTRNWMKSDNYELKKWTKEKKLAKKVLVENLRSIKSSPFLNDLHFLYDFAVTWPFRPPTLEIAFSLKFLESKGNSEFSALTSDWNWNKSVGYTQIWMRTSVIHSCQLPQRRSCFKRKLITWWKCQNLVRY